jgi:uncharacterized protein (TIGR02284 family)
MATQSQTVLDDKEVHNVLNGLIETCTDGEKGFASAAEKAKEGSLKALFLKYGAQRAEYARELKAAVRTLGGDPSESGHASGSLHRGWIKLKEALSSDSDKALIDECEAGEDAAMKNYKEALQKGLPSNVHSLVQQQFAGVSEAHGVIRDLKHSRQ